MDYYNINLFEEITQIELVEKLEKATLINCGSIAIFGDTVGKPGDIWYDLKSIEATTQMIIFHFGNSSIVVHDYKGIVVNDYVIGIKSASRVDWNWSKHEQLIYMNNNERLATKTNYKKHVFNTDKSQPAFLYHR